MSELSVRIVALPALRVASALGFGEQPEGEAWEKMFDFIKAKGLWEGMADLTFYGFNNPEPSPGNPNYGYEQWVVAPEDVEGTAEVEIKTFPGGKYAVTRCHGILNIGEIWEALVAWREGSPYLDGSHQWLEKWVNPCQDGLAPEDMVFDLFMPIAD